jgi:NADH dehydrogenase
LSIPALLFAFDESALAFLWIIFKEAPFFFQRWCCEGEIRLLFRDAVSSPIMEAAVENKKYGEKKIVIAGGGFGGIRSALALEAKRLRGVKIILVSQTPHFEYAAALYRVVTGRSPLEVCIPLREIFAGKNVEVAEDEIVAIDPAGKSMRGASGSHYRYDYAIAAFGSETAYFGIPGLRERSFGFKSIPQALRLKKHLHEAFAAALKAGPDEKISAAHIVIVGGGASGVELAGELTLYAKSVARNHGLLPSFVTIDLIEAASRLVPSLPEDVSGRIEKRLRSLGINIFLNRTVMEEDIKKIHLKDMEFKTETVIWTAGVKPHKMYGKIPGLELDKKGRAAVDRHLRAPKFPELFILGDGASTPYSGMAQTADHDGSYAADAIARAILKKPLVPYRPRAPIYAIPVGPGWAAVVKKNFRVYGMIGWWLRRSADFRYFLTILPFPKAILAFRNGARIAESCPLCSEKEKNFVLSGGRL